MGSFYEEWESYFFFAAGLRFAALRLAGAFLAAFFAGAFFTALRLAGAFLAAFLAVVFLAATVPPRGDRTFGLPESSYVLGWQRNA